HPVRAARARVRRPGRGMSSNRGPNPEYDERQSAVAGTTQSTLEDFRAATPSLYFEGTTFVPALLAVQILQEGNVCLGYDGRLYRYADGVYHSDGDAYM